MATLKYSNESSELMTTAEVATWLRVSPNTVRGWRATGKFGPTPIRVGGHRIVYIRAEVRSWLEGQRQHRQGVA